MLHDMYYRIYIPHSSHHCTALIPPPCTALVRRLNLKDLGLDRVLGGGAFGQVWRGTWRGTPVAVKVCVCVCVVDCDCWVLVDIYCILQMVSESCHVVSCHVMWCHVM
jgi:hypothetical protein